MPERIALPTDRPYPLTTDQRGATMTVDWPAELQQQVARVAREHNATSFMVVQAALLALLAKLSASSDVAVGFPIAGRRDPALDELVGFFVNTLVLRVDLAGDPDGYRDAGSGPRAQPGRLRSPGCAVRGARRAAEPDSIPGPPPTDPSERWHGRTSPGTTSMIQLSAWSWAICRSLGCRWTPTPPEWI